MSVSKCPTLLDCNCGANPFRNLSAELPDPPDFFDFEFFSAQVPLGAPDPFWGSTVGRDGCTSALSQQDAEDCAVRQSEEQVWDTWKGSGGSTIPLFGNHQTQCVIPCPTGFDPFIYTVPAGTVVARTQAEADALAESLCEYRGLREKVCVKTPKPATPENWWPMEEIGVVPRVDVVSGKLLTPIQFPAQLTTIPAKVGFGIKFAPDITDPFPTGSRVQCDNLATYPGTGIELYGWFDVRQNAPGLFLLFRYQFPTGEYLELHHEYTSPNIVLQLGAITASIARPADGFHLYRVYVNPNGVAPCAFGAVTFGVDIDNTPGVSGVFPYNPCPGGDSILRIGIENDGSNAGPSIGGVDEVAIFHQNLSTAERDTIWNSGHGTTWPIP